MSISSVFATVAVHTEEGRRSHFECPNCGRRISFTNAYPLSFRWKVCAGCRWQWTPAEYDSMGPHADKIAGQTNMIRVSSLGRCVDEPDMSISELAGMVEDHVGREVERRVGRPEVGPMVNVRMPEELIAWVDEQVAASGGTRAGFVRDVLQAAKETQR